ncbi:phosphotransferase family protein [Nocardioides sp. GXZ039]|uniref:phosphotransferase family protein n=1 Tax=Nocardioides sp. GXZ039 TaxID=3136018 RepID=UPI0030F49974
MLDDLGDFASLEPLAGGWSGETFLARVADETQDPVVVRIYGRDPSRAEVDAALLGLVRGLVPVADVRELRRARAELPALLLTSHLPGERGDLVWPRLDADGLAVLGRNVGDLVAILGGMPMVGPGGFVGSDLRIEPFGPDWPDGLVELVERDEQSFGHWTPAERAGLLDVAERAQDLLDTAARTCLVHSDLNPKNLLVDPDTLAITGLLDWEYAHAGHPFTDLGNVLRFERDPVYVDAVLDSYQRRRGTPPSEALELARAADLWALIDLAGRRGQNPVATAAEALLRGISGSGDAHWTPSEPPA